MDSHSAYRSAGVDIKKADRLVQWLKKQTQLKSSLQKQRPGVAHNIGSYSGLFPAVFKGMRKPVLAASADGVGTKLQLAEYFKSYREVGQDLTAMCVNDLICCGARPLFFLDYYACSRLQLKPAKQFLSGVLDACQKSGCLLLGGETAEMPHTYKNSHFDCAGFAVGVVEASKILGAHRVRPSDIVIGVSGEGFHSNGFSLLRKVFKKDLRNWKNTLLKPTPLYVSLALELFKVKGLKAMAHVTGGGMDNILRILPKGVQLRLKRWPLPGIFLEVQKRAKLNRRSLLKIFNCGVGLALIAAPSAAPGIQKIIIRHGLRAVDMGDLAKVSSHKMCKSFSLDP